LITLYRLQADRLRDLNARGRFEEVVEEFEGGGVVSNQTTLGEYVKALVKLDRLDGSLLLNTLNVHTSNLYPLGLGTGSEGQRGLQGIKHIGRLETISPLTKATDQLRLPKFLP